MSARAAHHRAGDRWRDYVWHMAGLAHDTMVVLLKEHPDWLGGLLAASGGASKLPPGFTVADSAQRRVDAVEVRCDALFVSGDERGPWCLVEVQLARDEAKARRWLLMASILFDERGGMGDVVVITARRGIARWADAVANVRGPLGTELALRPKVLLLDEDVAFRILDAGRPELSFFAAFSMHQRSGARARRVIERSIARSQSIEDDELRGEVEQAIYNVLSDAFAEQYKEWAMGVSQAMPHSRMQAIREEHEARGRAEGKAQGKAEALFQVLAARAITVDPSARGIILACRDTELLDAWIVRAVTVSSTEELFRL